MSIWMEYKDRIHLLTSRLRKYFLNQPRNDCSPVLSKVDRTSQNLYCLFSWKTSGFRYSSFDHVCQSSVSKGVTLYYIAPTLLGASYSFKLIPSIFPSDSKVFGDGVPILWQSSYQSIFATTSMATPATSHSNTNAPSQSPPAAGGL